MIPEAHIELTVCKFLRGFRLDLGPFLVARIVPRGVNLGHGSHVLSPLGCGYPGF